MPIVRFSDVVTINPTEKLPKDKIMPKIAMEYIKPFTKHITKYTIEKYSSGSKFKNGDTLFARITPSLENGKTAFVTNLPNNTVGFGSTEFLVFRANEKLLPEYLYYLTTTNEFREKAIKSMTGTSGRQRVQTDVIKEFLFDLPSLNQQQDILDMLSPLDEKISLNERINDNLVA